MQAMIDGADRQRTQELKFIEAKITGIEGLVGERIRGLKEEIKNTIDKQKD